MMPPAMAATATTPMRATTATVPAASTAPAMRRGEMRTAARPELGMSKRVPTTAMNRRGTAPDRPVKGVRRGVADSRMPESRRGAKASGGRGTDMRSGRGTTRNGRMCRRRHRGDACRAEASGHRRVAIADAAAMRRVMHPGVAGEGRMRVDRRIHPTVDQNVVMSPIE
jgi:hypothetical protein